MHFICNDWQFRDIIENVLGYDLARKNHFWIHYPEPHPDEGYKYAYKRERVHYKDIMATGNFTLTFADMKQIAVWHELQNLVNSKTLQLLVKTKAPNYSVGGFTIIV